MNQARAILWAQWRTMRNYYPREGVGWGAVIGAIWYGFWTLAAFAAARIVANPDNAALVKTALPGALLIVFLYWQVVPVLMAATGASLELKKLKVYPIPPRQLFAIEVMLRVTSGIEMLLVLTGIGLGTAFNPRLAGWAALAVIPFVLFNLFLAVGIRDLLLRLLARKRVREVVVFLMVMLTAVPRLMLSLEPRGHRHLPGFLMGESWSGFPWSSTAAWLQGTDAGNAAAVLAMWTMVAALFGRWQFLRTMAFDAEAAAAGDSKPEQRESWMERVYRLPSMLLRDPLAALVEKEIRMLARSSRFRLVFLMGFTFGIVVIPISITRGDTLLRSHYLTAVSVYSLLLLSESCFWNSFGFDRSAAQIYFLSPVPFGRVLAAKNLSALFFIALEISAITAVCGVVGMRLTPLLLGEAYSVAGVVTLFLLAAGNVMSVRNARGMNPSTQFRKNAAGRAQALLLFIYPIVFVPVALAYVAQWAFDSELAFFGVLALDAAVAGVIYKIALESAVGTAERRKEEMIAALSAGEGIIGG